MVLDSFRYVVKISTVFIVERSIGHIYSSLQMLIGSGEGGVGFTVAETKAMFRVHVPDRDAAYYWGHTKQGCRSQHISPGHPTMGSEPRLRGPYNFK